MPRYFLVVFALCAAGCDSKQRSMEKAKEVCADIVRASGVGPLPALSGMDMAKMQMEQCTVMQFAAREQMRASGKAHIYDQMAVCLHGAQDSQDMMSCMQEMQSAVVSSLAD